MSTPKLLSLDQVIDLLRAGQGTMNQREYAEKLGITPQSLSDIYHVRGRGRGNPGKRVLKFLGLAKTKGYRKGNLIYSPEEAGALLKKAQGDWPQAKFANKLKVEWSTLNKACNGKGPLNEQMQDAIGAYPVTMYAAKEGKSRGTNITNRRNAA